MPQEGPRKAQDALGKSPESLEARILRVLRGSALAQSPQGQDPTYFTRFAAPRDAEDHEGPTAAAEG